jgi:hypothetical protein
LQKTIILHTAAAETEWQKLRATATEIEAPKLDFEKKDEALFTRMFKRKILSAKMEENR